MCYIHCDDWCVCACVCVCLWWWNQWWGCVCFLCFLCPVEVGMVVVVWKWSSVGCASNVFFGVCFIIVLVVVMWPWPVWCGGSLRGVVLC